MNTTTVITFILRGPFLMNKKKTAFKTIFAQRDWGFEYHLETRLNTARQLGSMQIWI